MYFGDFSPFRMDSSLVGFVFFAAGHQMSRLVSVVHTTMSKIKISWAIVFFMILLLCTFANIDFNHLPALSINAMKFGSYPWCFIVSGLAGTFLVLLVSMLIEGSVCKSSYGRIVCNLSSSSIVFLAFHKPIMMLFYKFLPDDSIVSLAINVVLGVASSYCIASFLNSFAPKFIGGRLWISKK